MSAPPLDLPLLVALLAPLPLALLARHRALHANAETAARWFTFAGRLALLRTLSPLVWVLLLLNRLMHGSALGGWLVTQRGWAIVAAFVMILAPVGLLPALLSLVTHDVARRLGTTEFTWREVLARAAWGIAAALVTPLLLAMGALAVVRRDVLWSWAGFSGGLAFALFCATRARRGLTIAPHAVTHGELRDRLFEMAARAGVTLRQIYVLPMKRLRMANAFAVHGRVVMLTDLLLERLGRDEVDAVMAHEIAHLRRGDPLKLLRVRLACLAVPAVLAVQLGWPVGAPAMLAGLLLSSAFSRRIERATDLEALRLGASAPALISGLAKLARISHVPTRWGAWMRWFVTHPSIEQRARWVAAAGSLSEDEVARRLAGDGVAADRYALPAGVEGDGRVFSTRFKHSVRSRNNFQVLVIAVLVPAATFALGRRFDPTGALRAPLTLLALLVTPAVLLAAGSFLAVQPLRAIERRLAQRLGLGPDPRANGWRLAGLSPHAGPRLYEGFANWDLGFVRVERDALEFAGEETRFALGREAIAAVELADGVPSWIRSQTVRVRWRRGAGDERALRITPLDVAGVHAIRARSRRLAAEIVLWRDGATPEATGAAAITPIAGAPPSGDVTCTHPRALARPAGLVPVFVFDLAHAVVVCVLFRLPVFSLTAAGWLDVALVALASQVVLMIPLFRWRDPETPASPAAKVEPRAAA